MNRLTFGLLLPLLMAEAAVAYVGHVEGRYVTAWSRFKGRVRSRFRRFPRYVATLIEHGIPINFYSDGSKVPAMAGAEQVDRSDAQALMPEEVIKEIIQNVPQQSTIMRLARKLPNMSRKQARMPILSALVQAGFVNGEPTNSSPGGGVKPTTRAAWANKFINAEEIATIVPIPEAVLDDSDYDMWSEIRPRIEEAIGVVFDAAILYGTNAPSSWPDSILEGATSAGQVVTEGSIVDPTFSGTPGNDVYSDIFSPGGVLSLVEEDGYMVTGHVAALTLRAKLRGLRDNNGMPLFSAIPQAANRYVLDGQEVVFPTNGAVDRDESLLISGDWSQLVWAIRQDITYKILTEAVIQDENGDILYNLAQQDMVALRVVFRAGWQLPNPMNRVNQDDATRYPFAVLAPAGS